jgi:hypothetical protein
VCPGGANSAEDIWCVLVVQIAILCDGLEQRMAHSREFFFPLATLIG